LFCCWPWFDAAFALRQRCGFHLVCATQRLALGDRRGGYDSDPAQELAYRQSFDTGYRYGMIGVIRTYCFYPEPETRGFYEGSYSGLEVWNRLLGRQIPERDRRCIEISAARDGAKVTLTVEEGEPDASPNAAPPRR
jgi:hypothetical protein